MSKHAAEFERIIDEGRQRKKNEALAAQIFGRTDNRRSSAPIKPNAGGSLASRVGVKKRGSSGAPIPAGNVNGEWTHDLHDPRDGKNNGRAPRQSGPGSLASRIHAPGTSLPKTRQNQTQNQTQTRAARLANAYDRTTSSPGNARQHLNVTNGRQPSQAQGITIRGLAGPFCVQASNFAPGTTAADIESAVTPVGGLVVSCRLVKTSPIVVAEIVFESKEGADRVIETFHNQTADGRTIQVFHKPGGSTYNPSPPTGPRSQRNTNESHLGGNSVVVDGSMGFDDPMEMDDGRKPANGGGLRSDQLVSKREQAGSRRGRGFRASGR
ncbi:hypothetical protein F4780DRAFT_546907 [Xylariomycetidae sp. FL0641]|nr:hypothetical protein F4780DRAFT_546907 [Xylariomycetidae sp. FL0641]